MFSTQLYGYDGELSDEDLNNTGFSQTFCNC